jgi:hypothetical protein
MDILIQSLLQKARKFGTSLHIRYSARVPTSGTPNEAKQNQPSSSTGGAMTSLVIIQKDYSYLEPLVRSIFEEAEDVTILIDRRGAENRTDSALPPESDRRVAPERRSSAPMLDILINVPSPAPS